MPELIRLAARRNEIVNEIGTIKSMRKGTLNTSFNKVTNKKGEEVINGPYYVLTRRGSDNKTVSERIPTADAPHVQEEVDNYRRFRQLADEYVDICEKISFLSNSGDEGKKN